MEEAVKQLNERRIALLRTTLLEWYAANARQFAWRQHDDPYAILVLEVMSQQTQLERVSDAWSQFIRRWPSPDSLGNTPRGEVIAFWSNHALGYNRRAEYLHRAATHIVAEWDGTLPADPDKLQELPGVGPYTASAVASFAFDRPHAVLDTNVKRILYRVFGEDAGEFEDIADRLLPDDKASDWNNAIMDLGATVCTATPQCDEAPCPWREQCTAYALGSFDSPNSPTQSTFEGSRRQFRGRIVRTLASNGAREIDGIGRAISEEYDPTSQADRSWVYDLLQDLADDGLVSFDEEQEIAALPSTPEQL